MVHLYTSAQLRSADIFASRKFTGYRHAISFYSILETLKNLIEFRDAHRNSTASDIAASLWRLNKCCVCKETALFWFDLVSFISLQSSRTSFDSCVVVILKNKWFNYSYKRSITVKMYSGIENTHMVQYFPPHPKCTNWYSVFQPQDTQTLQTHRQYFLLFPLILSNPGNTAFCNILCFQGSKDRKAWASPHLCMSRSSTELKASRIPALTQVSTTSASSLQARPPNEHAARLRITFVKLISEARWNWILFPLSGALFRICGATPCTCQVDIYVFYKLFFRVWF